MLSSKVVFHLVLKVLRGFYKILLFKPYEYSTTFYNSRKNIKKPSFLKTKMLNVYTMLSSNFYWIYQLALLIVDGPDNVTIKPSSSPVIENSSVQLVCSASCIYRCQSYSWKYNDELKIQKTHILNLHSLSREDSGKYECQVTDDFGATNSEYFTLNVQCKSWFVNQGWRVVLAFYI